MAGFTGLSTRRPSSTGRIGPPHTGMCPGKLRASNPQPEPDPHPTAAAAVAAALALPSLHRPPHPHLTPTSLLRYYPPWYYRPPPPWWAPPPPVVRPGVVVVGDAVPSAVEATEASEIYPVMVLDVGRCQLMRRLRPVEERNDGVYADAAVPTQPSPSFPQPHHQPQPQLEPNPATLALTSVHRTCSHTLSSTPGTPTQPCSTRPMPTARPSSGRSHSARGR